MKRCSTLLINTETQIKTTMRYHLTLVRMSIIRRSTNNSRVGVEKSELYYAVEGNVNWCSYYGEKVWRFLKKTKNRTTIWSTNPTPGHVSRKNENSNFKRYMHPNILDSTVYNSQDLEATQAPINKQLA